jgi:hypothetical protein
MYEVGLVKVKLARLKHLRGNLFKQGKRSRMIRVHLIETHSRSALSSVLLMFAAIFSKKKILRFLRKLFLNGVCSFRNVFTPDIN